MITQTEYLPRIADNLLKAKLSYSGAVLIEGPKWCGKTWTARQMAKSELKMQDPDNSAKYLQVANLQPSQLLLGDTPRLLDEWQMAPVLWDAVRYAVDERNDVGQFILTGSAVPTDNQTMHSGVGRIARLKMYPMSLYESRESNGAISLKDLFSAPETISAESKLSLPEIAFVITRGGWPAAVTSKTEASALARASEYIDQVIESDVSRLDNIEKNPERVRMLLRSYARNISTLASLKTIRDDVFTEYRDGLSDKTISQYLNILNRIFVIQDIPAWQPSLRSKTAIRTAAKRQFIDPSLAAAVMRLTPDRFFDEINYFGFLFESLCERDLKIYAEAIDGDLYHYRDADGLEIDAIICLRNGHWGAIEIKLGDTDYEEAAANLIALSEKVETKNQPKPSFLAIVTGQDYAYRREDGVYVVPIGCLKP